jgi:hypothetical protein
VADDSASIPPRVRQFIIDHIDSVMQLEMLLLVAAPPQRAWTAKDLADLLRIDPAWVETQLRAMTAGGLVVAQQPDPAAFRYEPRSAELSQAVDELAKTYADRRVTVIGLIFAKPIDKIRSFADAFRLRKDKTD